MGKLSNIKADAKADVSINNMTKLYQLKVDFCIVNVKATNTKFGEAWVVEIAVDEAFCEELKCDELGHTVVFIQKANTSKDKTLQRMVGETPIHSVHVTGTPTPSGMWYDFEETQRDCPCGEPWVAEETSTPASEITPF